MGLIQKLRLSRRRSRGLLSSLLLAGVFPHGLSRMGFDIRKYLWTAFCIYSFGYVIVFTTYNLLRLQSHSFMVKVSSVKTIISALMCLVILLITQLKSRHLVAIVNQVEQNFYTYTNEHRFQYTFSVSHRSERTLMYGSTCFFVVIYLSAWLSHPLYLLFNRDLLKSGAKMLTHTWVPFEGDTVLSFLMAHALLFTVTFPVSLTMAGSVCFSLHVYLELRDQFERLGYVLQQSERRIRRMDADSDGCQLFSAQQATVFENLLVECVKHYQSIRKCFNEFKNWFGLTYSIVLAHSVATLAMMTYGALLNIHNFGVSLKYVSVLLAYTVQVYMFCYTADRIYDINENLAKVLLGVPWYRQPANKRKIFYIFVCEVQRPFRLLGIKIYPASLNVFGSIMKLSYSYLNLLRTYGSSFRKF